MLTQLTKPALGFDASDEVMINTIRGLALDMIQKADSGHPGTPLGIAPAAYVLWNQYLRYDPADPIWPNRDRFVLSEGHASALLWSLLHLVGVRAVDEDYEVGRDDAVTMDDMRSFRQLGSHCPGHPEYRLTSGVETTTGPLGQGVATSVGMAIASRWLANRYNTAEHTLFDFDVYALAGDGCMMEGVASEAASYAGHLGLSNLCWIYDSNRVTIEGHTDLTFTEDTAARFISYGWNVTTVADANDLESLDRAFRVFRAEQQRPTLILVHSHIGYGSPLEDDPRVHGAPLGPEGVQATKRFLGLPENVEFYIPEGVRERFREGIGARGRSLRSAWEDTFRSYRSVHGDLAEEISQMQRRALPDDWDRRLPEYPADPAGKATRISSGEMLNTIAERVPWLLGGSADLSPSTHTTLDFSEAGELQAATPGGRNLHLGVREHAAAAIANGLAVSKLRPFWSTYLTFSDYARGAVRLSALMEVPVIHVFTHDSVGVGEDGPTHQPVEQLPSLRGIPGLLVFRPCDANEVVETWRTVMQLKHEPAAVVLSRQAVPTLDRNLLAPADGVARGGYVLADTEGEPDVILIATGSEVGLAVAAREELAADGVAARVVSLPCWELFDRQPRDYRDSVIPPSVRARVAIELASTLGWDRYVGDHGRVIGMHTFGASAPLKALESRFGFTPDAVAATARSCIEAIGDV